MPRIFILPPKKYCGLSYYRIDQKSLTDTVRRRTRDRMRSEDGHIGACPKQKHRRRRRRRLIEIIYNCVVFAFGFDSLNYFRRHCDRVFGGLLQRTEPTQIHP